MYTLWAFLFGSFSEADHPEPTKMAMWEAVHYPLHFVMLVLSAAMIVSGQAVSEPDLWPLTAHRTKLHSYRFGKASIAPSNMWLWIQARPSLASVKGRAPGFLMPPCRNTQTTSIGST